MEHHRSTLAVTAIAVSALLCASLFLQAGPLSDHSDRPGTAVAQAVAGSGWTDPPGSPRINIAASEPETGVRPSLAPSLTVLPPPVAPMPAGVSTPRPEQPRKAVEAHRKKVAQRSARPRPSAPERGPIVQAAAVAQPAPASAKGIDLIGDLIRGLGIGRDQQG